MNATRWRCRCYRSTGYRPPKPQTGAPARDWSGWYRTREGRVLVASVVLEADAPDSAVQEAQRLYPAADYIETEPVGPDLPPAA